MRRPESRALTRRLQDLITSYPGRTVVCEATQKPQEWGDPAVCGGAFAFGYTQHFVGAGSSPAIADRNLYTIGTAGLAAFGPPPPRADVNTDGTIDLEDLYAWHRGQGQRDVDGNGSITDADRAALEAELRRDEFADMAAGRLP